MMKLSIIVPAYNCESTIAKCLSSIVDSNANEYEIIVVNDGSTDNTQTILNQFSSQYEFIRVYEVKNAGVSGARNLGIQKANGDYISFVDSDDYVTTDYVKTLLLETQSNKDVYFFKGIIVSKKIFLNKEHWIGELNQKTKEDVAKNILLGKSNVPWDKAYKREIIDNYNIRFKENISLGEDWIFSMDFIEKCESYRSIPKGLYYYCIREGSLSQKKMTEKMLDDQCKLAERILSFGKNGLTAKKMALQLLTNSCAKIYKSGFSKDRIYSLLEKNDWYCEIIQYKYTDIKSKLRAFLMNHQALRVISHMFTR